MPYQNPIAPLSESGKPARRQWLVHTLYALRGHFREEKTDDPDDLRQSPSGTEGVIIHCSDGRDQEIKFLNLKPGDYYESTKLGANVVSDEDTRSNELKVLLNRALLLNRDKEAPDPIRFCVIMGHEKCGANNTLLTSQIAPSSITEYQESEAGYMRNMATPGLGDALRHALKNKADPSLLHEHVSQSTVLNSMQNIYGYTLATTRVQKLVDEGALQIIGAIRGLKQKDGKFPLSVYDPDKEEFCPIETLYLEAFPGSNELSEGKIEEAMKALQKPDHGLILPQRAQSRTIAEINRDGIRNGLQRVLDNIHREGIAR